VKTANEAKTLASAHLTQLHGKPCAVFDWSTRETPTHWHFQWNTVAAMDGSEDALKGVDPVAVDKRTGAVAIDRKRQEHEACNVAFPAPPHGPVASAADAAALVQAWVDATMEKPCFVKLYRELTVGWAFVWNSEASLSDPLESYVGQGPTVVVRETGEIFDIGSAPPIDERLEAFERELLARR
jgi:hypothetical protein